ncbi:MAG TPA: MBL fold metallo-hydrolase [Firmicutes bacterium]|nr:MBL fold metallo-hydrolase [Bacillota bacterium]
MSDLIFRALGGASEVGASCYYLGLLKNGAATPSYGILLDCGVRPNAIGEASLPALSCLEGLPVDLVLVTHAHLDHCGALPVIRKLVPGARVFATEPTIELAKLMLQDAAKVGEQEGAPLFSPGEAMEAAASVQSLPFGQTIDMGQATVTAWPAGHILGAAYYEIEFGPYRILYTGDISITSQHTVGSAAMPPGTNPVDVVVSESTYGNILLPSRKEEVRAFVLAVQSVIARGGRVLIPSFALGRAQEIILILLGAITSRDLPPTVPIYLDGLVRGVTEAYVRLSDFLPEKLANFIRNSRQNPFLRDPVRVVSSQAERLEIIRDRRPSVIVASSGMLTGGVSPMYAAEILREEESAVFFVGYQDEESPGGRILELGPGDSIRLGQQGIEVEIAASIEQYKLSAHADSAGLQNFLSRFPSHSILLVHGDNAARDNLFSAMKTDRVVWKPKNGDVFDPLSAPAWLTAPAAPDQRGEPVKVESRKVQGTVECRPDGSVAVVYPPEVKEMFEGITAVRTVLRRSPVKLRIEGAANPAGDGGEDGEEEPGKMPAE